MTVSLVGLPGSGKTTLCRPLAMELGYEAFVLGDALRNRSQTDFNLRVALARGELAPEPLVFDLIREAVNGARAKGLVLDGFPRHKGQIEFAKDVFESWCVLWLDCDIDTATVRLVERRVCASCGFAQSGKAEMVCPRCGASNWKARAEDNSSIVTARLAAFRTLLLSMLNELPNDVIHRIDSTQSVSAVKEQAVLLLRHLW